MRIAAFLTALLSLPTGLGAHPHIFVDTSLRLDTNAAGEAIGITVTWAYDDFFTLLIFEDMGLDDDFDGVLTEAELARLKGFDLIEWPDGFEGDLYFYQGDTQHPLAFPTPEDVSVKEGRIIATHYRSFAPIALNDLTIRQYDPTFYVAYEVTGGISVPGPCTAHILKPDLDAAAQQVEALNTSDPEMMFETAEVGIYYADTIRFACPES